jgi:hypothetical protein
MRRASGARCTALQRLPLGYAEEIRPPCAAPCLPLGVAASG